MKLLLLQALFTVGIYLVLRILKRHRDTLERYAMHDAERKAKTRPSSRQPWYPDGSEPITVVGPDTVVNMPNGSSFRLVSHMSAAAMSQREAHAMYQSARAEVMARRVEMEQLRKELETDPTAITFFQNGNMLKIR